MNHYWSENYRRVALTRITTVINNSNGARYSNLHMTYFTESNITKAIHHIQYLRR